MAGPTTEVLNEDVKELRESVHSLEVRMASEFGRLDARVSSEFSRLDGKIDARFEQLEERLNNFKGVSKWSVDRAWAIIVLLIAFAFTLAWYASKFDSRLSQIEQSKIESPKR
jgi:hypothetical protein